MSRQVNRKGALHGGYREALRSRLEIMAEVTAAREGIAKGGDELRSIQTTDAAADQKVTHLNSGPSSGGLALCMTNEPFSES